MIGKSDPSPAEIHEECEQIRHGWTEETYARRLTVGGQDLREIAVPRELAGCVEAYNAT